MGWSLTIYIWDPNWWCFGKSVHIETTWVWSTQKRIRVVRHGEKISVPNCQQEKPWWKGEKIRTPFTKLWRQAWENWIRSSVKESKGVVRRWRRKRYLFSVKRKRPVFARRPLQFPPRNTDRAQKPEHTAATPSEPATSRSIRENKGPSLVKKTSQNSSSAQSPRYKIWGQISGREWKTTAKEKDKAAFNSFSEDWVLPAASTKEPEERELW